MESRLVRACGCVVDTAEDGVASTAWCSEHANAAAVEVKPGAATAMLETETRVAELAAECSRLSAENAGLRKVDAMGIHARETLRADLAAMREPLSHLAAAMIALRPFPLVVDAVAADLIERAKRALVSDAGAALLAEHQRRVDAIKDERDQCAAQLAAVDIVLAEGPEATKVARGEWAHSLTLDRARALLAERGALEKLLGKARHTVDASMRQGEAAHRLEYRQGLLDEIDDALKGRFCRNLSPSWFTGRWRDWHRGHGCDLDDGRARSPEAVAALAKGGT